MGKHADKHSRTENLTSTEYDIKVVDAILDGYSVREDNPHTGRNQPNEHAHVTVHDQWNSSDVVYNKTSNDSPEIRENTSSNNESSDNE